MLQYFCHKLFTDIHTINIHDFLFVPDKKMSKKLYNPNKPEDLAEIHRLLEASDEEFGEENFENESDIDSEDNVEEREEG
jgi:hypothetical protein